MMSYVFSGICLVTQLEFMGQWNTAEWVVSSSAGESLFWKRSNKLTGGFTWVYEMHITKTWRFWF